MTTLHLQQTTSSTETVTSSIIEKLYEIALNTQDVYLEGSLRVDSIYQNQYDYLRGRFQNLYITASDILIYFEDPVYEAAVKQFLRSYYNGFNEKVTAQITSTITRDWLRADTSFERNNAFWRMHQNDSLTKVDFSVFPNLERLEVDFIRSQNLQTINTGYITEISNRYVEGAAYIGSIFTSSKSITGDSRSGDDTTPNLQQIICPNVRRINRTGLAETGAREIYLPKVVYILAYMIRHAPNLNLMYVGKDVQYIHNKMFDGDAREYPSEFSFVLNCATPPTVFTNVDDAADMTTFSFTQGSFGGNATGRMWIYVPDSSLNAYKTHACWSNVSSRFKPMSELDSTTVNKITSITNDTLLT